MNTEPNFYEIVGNEYIDEESKMSDYLALGFIKEDKIKELFEEIEKELNECLVLKK